MLVSRVTDILQRPIRNLLVLGTVLGGLVTFFFSGMSGEILRWHGQHSVNTVTYEPAGTQFYVATTGSDSNNGTSTSAPWRTIQKAMNSATPSSTVNIMAGTYHERPALGVSGTSGNYITFQPYGFSVPVGGCGGYSGVVCGGDQVILQQVPESPEYLPSQGRDGCASCHLCLGACA